MRSEASESGENAAKKVNKQNSLPFVPKSAKFYNEMLQFHYKKVSIATHIFYVCYSSNFVKKVVKKVVN